MIPWRCAHCQTIVIGDFCYRCGEPDITGSSLSADDPELEQMEAVAPLMYYIIQEANELLDLEDEPDLSDKIDYVIQGIREKKDLTAR